MYLQARGSLGVWQPGLSQLTAISLIRSVPNELTGSGRGQSVDSQRRHSQASSRQQARQRPRAGPCQAKAGRLVSRGHGIRSTPTLRGPVCFPVETLSLSGFLGSLVFCMQPTGSARTCFLFVRYSLRVTGVAQAAEQWIVVGRIASSFILPKGEVQLGG